MLLYKEESTFLPNKSIVSLTLGLIGVLLGLVESKPNFFHKIFGNPMNLQSNEVIQLSNHAHLELDLHKLQKIMSKFILCRLEDDIINIDLSNYQLTILLSL